MQKHPLLSRNGFFKNTMTISIVFGAIAGRSALVAYVLIWLGSASILYAPEKIRFRPDVHFGGDVHFGREWLGIGRPPYKDIYSILKDPETDDPFRVRSVPSGAAVGRFYWLPSE
jgi:hypothetical protein